MNAAAGLAWIIPATVVVGAALMVLAAAATRPVRPVRAGGVTAAAAAGV